MIRTAVAASVLVVLLVTSVAAQRPPSLTPLDSWQMFGRTTAIARQGHTLYLAGGNYAAPPTGAFATFDRATGALLPRPRVSIEPNAVATDPSALPLPDGGWLIHSIEPSLDSSLSRARPDGSLDPGWRVPLPPFSRVTAMVTDGTVLYVAYQGFPVRIAAFDLATAQPSPFAVDVQCGCAENDVAVSGLFLSGGTLYATGDLQEVNGQPLFVTGLAAISIADESVQLIAYPQSTTDVRLRASFTDKLYLSSNTTGLVFDLDTGTIEAWPFPAEAVVVAASASTLFGTRFNVLSAELEIVPLSPSTGRISGAPISRRLPNGSHPRFVADATTLYVASAYDDGYRLFRYDVATLAELPGDVFMATAPAALVPGPGEITVVGAWAGGFYHGGIFAIDVRTGQPTGFTATVAADSPAPGEALVQAMQALGNFLVIGGNFSRVYGQTQFGLAAIDTTTGTVLPWAPLSTGIVRALATDGQWLYVGGRFDLVFGRSRPNLAAFSLATADVTAWTPAPNSQVRSLVVDGSWVVAGGDFVAVAGGPRNRIAVFPAGSDVPAPFNPSGALAPVRTVAVAQGKVFSYSYVESSGGGSFHAFDPAGRLLPITTPWTVPTFLDHHGVTAIAAHDDNVYVSGGAGVPGQPFGTTAISAQSGSLLWSVPTYSSHIAAFPDLVALLPVSGLVLYEIPSAGPPSHLRARVTGTTVALSWAPPFDAVPTAYVLEAGTAAGLSNLAQIPLAGTSLTAGVGAGTYYVRLRAVADGSPGVPSSELILTTPSPSAPPQAPGPLTAAVSSGVVALSWGAASGNAESYVIEAGAASGLTNLAVLDTGVLDTQFAAAVPAGTYYVRIRARNGFGASTPSNELTLVVP
jgi:outer membrane protein assembly factor BamB